MPSRVRSAAFEFLAAAFRVLETVDVLPRSRYDMWMRVGTDFEGSLVMHLPEFERLEEALNETYPARFPKGVVGGDFPQSYIFGLLRAAVALATLAGELYATASPSVQAAVYELEESLSAPDVVVRVVWVYTGVSVRDGPLVIGRLQLQGIHESVVQDVEGLIPGSGRLAYDVRPIHDSETSALLVLTTPESRSYNDRFGGGDREASLLTTALRMLSNATVFVAALVSGQPSVISARGPFTRPGQGSGWIGQGERILDVAPSTFAAAVALVDAIKSLESTGDGTSPVLVAIDRYNTSLTAGSWRDAIVDISVGLEAALGDATENESVLLRLRLRAAELLWMPDDPPARIWDDVGHLYTLRSKILHGTTFKPALIEKTTAKVTYGARSRWPGEKLTLAIDRWRDLLRRAILARIAVGSQPDPLWSWTGQPPVVERELGDPANRTKWHDRIAERLAQIGAEVTAQPNPLRGLFGIPPDENLALDSGRAATILPDPAEPLATATEGLEEEAAAVAGDQQLGHGGEKGPVGSAPSDELAD